MKETCKNCGGCGYTIEVEAECCRNFTDYGCCGIPDPIQVQVKCNCEYTFKFQAWYRDNDEKDFFIGEVDADSWESAQEQIKNKDRRIYKVEKP